MCNENQHRSTVDNCNATARLALGIHFGQGAPSRLLGSDLLVKLALCVHVRTNATEQAEHKEDRGQCRRGQYFGTEFHLHQLQFSNTSLINVFDSITSDVTCLKSRLTCTDKSLSYGFLQGIKSQKYVLL
jgi:hypothetical protein